MDVTATVCAYRGHRLCPIIQAVALSNIHMFLRITSPQLKGSACATPFITLTVTNVADTARTIPRIAKITLTFVFIAGA
jgi:hypothetical protein